MHLRGAFSDVRGCRVPRGACACVVHVGYAARGAERSRGGKKRASFRKNQRVVGRKRFVLSVYFVKETCRG